MLTIFWVTLLGMEYKKNNELTVKDMTDYSDWLNSNVQQLNKSDSIIDNNFYSKLNNSQDVKILIIGDELLLNNDKNTQDNWCNNLSAWIESNYQNHVKIISLCKDKCNVIQGNEILLNNPDIQDFDLGIICFGYNDSLNKTNLNEFTQSYSDLISKLRSINYNCTLVSILPPNLSSENQYRHNIQSVCDINNVSLLDLLSDFNNSSSSFDNLINNNLLTANGYAILEQSITSSIKLNIDKF